MDPEKVSISAKLISVDEIRDIVISFYNWNLINSIDAITQGVESAAWLFQTDKGDYYVKVYGLHEGPPERIQEEVNLYAFLRSKCIHVPEVIENKNREEVSVIEYKGKHFCMIVMKKEELRAVSPSTITDEEMRQIAREVAKSI